MELKRLKVLLESQRSADKSGIKFNLIGHSHGAHAVRYVAAVEPDLVASVLVVAGPNQGSAVADAVLRLHPKVIDIVAAKIDKVFADMREKQGVGKQNWDSEAAVRSLSTVGAKKFNNSFPEGSPQSCGLPTSAQAYQASLKEYFGSVVFKPTQQRIASSSKSIVENGVRYYSVSGTVDWESLKIYNDFSDFAYHIPASVFSSEANDGLVGRCSSHWGEVLRDDYPWSHGEIAGRGNRIKGAPDPVAFYRAHANRLKQLGL